MAANSTGRAATEQELRGFFRRYMADPKTSIPDVGNPLQERLDAHFGVDTDTLETASVRKAQYMEVAYQRAIEEFLDRPECESEILGIQCPSIPDYQMGEMALAWLLCRPTFAFVPPVFCPPDYGMIPSGLNETEFCLQQGLIFFTDEDGPGLMWVRRSGSFDKEVVVEVMADTFERCERITDGLQAAAVRLSPYQGQVIELVHQPGKPMLNFLERPRATSRDDVILPAGLLDQIERHSLGAVRAHEALVESGRHSKRGLLLHGRPGTGKTHTIKYLIGQMPDATVLVMSASKMAYLHEIRQVIDVVVPGVIILDDVDLVAEDREMAGNRDALFDMLEVLDGIDEDADLLFVMTTNRPNEIEPAIAARPGRIDQAIEVPLPDADCRNRLFDLYCAGLNVEMSADELDLFLQRTDGVTASFIREALRRAAVAAMRDDLSDPVTVSGERIHKALDELLAPDNPLTPLLLGALPKHAVATVTVSSLNGPA